MQLSVNGIDTFVATGGRPFDPALPAVVMLHGAGFDHSTWALHSRWFAHHGHSVLAPDLPAHGRSAGAALPTIADMADWTAALLEAAGAAKAKLIGHSMGSLIALETSARHPGKVSGLGLIGTAATMTVGPDLLRAAEANSADAFDMVSIWGLGLRPNSAAASRRDYGCIRARNACCNSRDRACCSTISTPAIPTRTRSMPPRRSRCPRHSCSASAT